MVDMELPICSSGPYPTGAPDSAPSVRFGRGDNGATETGTIAFGGAETSFGAPSPVGSVDFGFTQMLEAGGALVQ